MNNYLRLVMNSIVPFIMIGVGVSLIIGLLILFSYVLIWGIFFGIILWIIASIKAYFFPSTTSNQSNVIIRGRIIEHNKNKR